MAIGRSSMEALKPMTIDALKAVARTIVAEQKGVLAADESGPTIKRRCEAIRLASTEENHRRIARLTGRAVAPAR